LHQEAIEMRKHPAEFRQKVDDNLFADKFLVRLEADYPELFEPRWGDFDRSVSFAY